MAPVTPPLPVTVVVATWKRPGLLLSTLESVFAQSPPPREVIVVDDGSPDDTAARVAPLAEAGRIRYVRQANAGMAAARNAGARLATSEYLYFLDDDDLLFPGALPALVGEMDRRHDAAFVCGELIEFRGDHPGPPPALAGPPTPVDPAAFLRFNGLGSPGQVLIRREAFAAVGGFDGTIWGTDDWDLWLRLLARHPAWRVPVPVLAYRLHGNNASRDVARMYRSSLRVARAHTAAVPADRRAAARFQSRLALRAYHAPRIAAQVRAAAGAGAWGAGLRAAATWVNCWAVDLGARVLLKASLARQGRWRLPSPAAAPEVPLAAPVPVRVPVAAAPGSVDSYSARSVVAESTRDTHRAGA